MRVNRKGVICCVGCLVVILLLIVIYAITGNQKKEPQKSIHGIVCWGDSLTYGYGASSEQSSYPAVLQELVNEKFADISVYNMGVGMEQPETTAARQGGIPIVTKNTIVIPKTTEPIEIPLILKNGNAVNVLRMAETGMERVWLGDIEGKLSIEQQSNTDTEYKYFFNRNEKGEAVEISGGTELIPLGAKEYNDCIAVIWTGQNGGWSSATELMTTIDRMIDYLEDKRKYLVLGLTSGTKAEREELEEEMKNHYGDNYINLREYLSKNGLEEVGIEPTPEDHAFIEEGKVPKSLLYDDVHMNNYGYQVVGNAVYDRMIQLNFLGNEGTRRYMK